MPAPVFVPARHKAVTVTAAFAVIVTAFVVWRGFVPGMLPTLIVYAMILLNTYPSVALFSSVTPPRDAADHVLEAAIVLLYLGMALSVGEPLLFAACFTVMFAFATLKYTALLRYGRQRVLLHRKIKVDALGVCTGCLTCLGMLMWNVDASLWLMAGVFTLAQIDIFFSHPLYVPSE